MAEYLEGHVKHDPASKRVAIRTGFPNVDAYAGSQWLAASSAHGAGFVTNAEVEGWEDLYDPADPPA